MLSKKIQVLIASASVLVLAGMIGCAAVQDAVVPCYISPLSIEYAKAEPTVFLPFTTLWDAKRIDMKMDFIHLSNQVADKMKYDFLKGLNIVHMMPAQELQAALFSPTGPLGLLLPGLSGTGLGWLLLKRPGDKSVKDIEKENGINNKTNA